MKTALLSGIIGLLLGCFGTWAVMGRYEIIKVNDEVTLQLDKWTGEALKIPLTPTL